MTLGTRRKSDYENSESFNLKHRKLISPRRHIKLSSNLQMERRDKIAGTPSTIICTHSNNSMSQIKTNIWSDSKSITNHYHQYPKKKKKTDKMWDSMFYFHFYYDSFLCRCSTKYVLISVMGILLLIGAILTAILVTIVNKSTMTRVTCKIDCFDIYLLFLLL